MPRRKRVIKREVLPDPKYHDPMVTIFINNIMKSGKKSVAEKIFYQAIEIVEQKLKMPGIEVFKQSLNNIKPVLEVKPRRVGGATYQVPIEVKPERRTALAIRWMIIAAKARSEKTMRDRLAGEIMSANKNEGGAVKKKEDTHKMAEANKAFSHFRF
ncbi:30S ribosomal protein S7 [candidate division TA06 bacterium]|jgi:small subunit ribosomal protein S7|nr:30S ribosomal protein S7 [candidate division TA06 bacterium]